MADRTIVRTITQTRVIIRQTSVGPKVIIRNRGPVGEDGDSAYAVAVANGFVGTEQDWLDSLVGDDGPPGVVAAEAPLSYNSLTQTIETDDLVTALAALIPLTQKGAANGVASLDGAGKVPAAQLPAGPVTFVSTWNATTNTPAIPAASAANVGLYYRVATAGSTSIDGVTDWKVGDWLVSNGTIWQKVDNTDPAGVSDVPGLVTALGLKADQTALDSEETDRIAGDAALQAEIDAHVPASTLLFSTDLRTGYANTAALQAAISGGTHPIFASSSSSDLVARLSFDDVITYLGAGTVKATGFVSFDHLPGGPVTDCWMRSIVRFSPSLNVVSQLLGAFGFGVGIYDDNVNYLDFVEWYLSYSESLTTAVGDAHVFHLAESEDENGSLSATAVQDGAFRNFVVHVVRGPTAFGFDTWIDGVHFSRHSIAIPPGFVTDLTVLEPVLAPVPGAETSSDPGDYLHMALLESYAGGDPYGLLAGLPANALHEEVVALEAQIAAKADQTDLDAEEAARISADSSEATTRGNADTALDTRVDALELAPPAHTHPESDVTNLVTDLAAKATTAALSSEASTRGAADTTLQSNIDAEASARAAADALLIPLSQKAAASGVATLDSGGKVPSAQLPAVALVKPTVVADLAARLALTAEAGDVAVQTDTTKTYMLKEAGDPTIDADWIELKAPSGGAPAGSPYVTFATDATLSNERVTTDTPTVAWDIGTAGQVKASVPDSAITAAKILADAITTVKILDANVTAAKLADSGATAATYGSATKSPVIAVDAKGRITSASEATITAGASVGSATPLVPAVTGAAGSSANASREDHVHPAGGLLIRRFKSGNNYGNGYSTGGVQAMGANLGAWVSFPVGVTTTFDRIGIEVSTGAATSVIRLAIYNDDGNGYPGTLVLDAGTIDASSAGFKTITISQALTSGMYWLLARVETMLCTVRTQQGSAWMTPISATWWQNGGCWIKSGYTGTIGTAPSGATSDSQNAPSMWMRAA